MCLQNLLTRASFMSLPGWISMSVCVSPCMEPAKNVSLGHENVTCTYHGHSQGRREGRSTERMLGGRLEFLNVLPFQNKI